MKKRLAVYGLLGVLVYVSVVGYVYLSDGVTRENYLQIKREMTKSEIHGMLGGLFANRDHTEHLGMGGVRESWFGKEGTIILVFDGDDQIIWKEWDNTVHRRGFMVQQVRE
jgi:hypothetical protein